MTLLHFIVLILHDRGIDVEKPRNLEGDFSFIFYSAFCSGEKKKPRLQTSPDPKFDCKPDTEGREKEALFMPSILEKPSKNSSFLDKEGPGNIARTDRISSYLPHEHWYCKLQLPNFKVFFYLAAYKKIFMCLRRHL